MKREGEEHNDPSRLWDQAFEAWKNSGCAGKPPGEHPNPNHPWNIDPQNFCQDKGVKYDFKQPDKKEEPEEY